MGQVADEPSHAARAAALLHGEIIGSKTLFGTTPEAGVDVDWGIISASLAELHENGHPLLSEADRAQARAIPWSNQRLFDPSSGTVTSLPALYSPGALGIGVGGLIDLGPLQSLYLGRAFMLIAFVLIGTMCLWFARAGQGLFFTLLSLPMTMSLGASFNQDGMIIASCSLAGALLTLDEKEYPKARWAAASIIAVVICSKPPYGLLLFTAALPIAARGAMRRLVVTGLFGLPALAWLVLMMRTSFVLHQLAPYHPGPLWPGDPNILFNGPDAGAGIRVLLHAPALIVTLPYHYLTLYSVGMKIEVIGWLGWLDAPLSHIQYVAWGVAIMAALAGALFGHGRGARRWRMPDALFVSAVIVASVIAICLSLYLSWTPVGATLIQGVQGRYMLPLVPFLPLALPRLGALVRGQGQLERYAAWIEIASVLPSVLLSCYDIVALPALMHARFG